MAILGFHFSGFYKDVLFNKLKTATIMKGEHFFNIGEEVQIYLSEKQNLFDGVDEKRIGKAIIQKIIIKKVSELKNEEAISCGSNNLEELKSALFKWYNCNDNSIITYIKFKPDFF
jgi:hypothetical protein